MFPISLVNKNCTLLVLILTSPDISKLYTLALRILKFINNNPIGKVYVTYDSGKWVKWLSN